MTAFQIHVGLVTESSAGTDFPDGGWATSEFSITSTFCCKKSCTETFILLIFFCFFSFFFFVFFLHTLFTLCSSSISGSSSCGNVVLSQSRRAKINICFEIWRAIMISTFLRSIFFTNAGSCLCYYLLKKDNSDLNRTYLYITTQLKSGYCRHSDTETIRRRLLNKVLSI